MSGKLNYIGTIKKVVDTDELRDTVSSYVRNRGDMVNITGTDDRSFVVEAKPDLTGGMHGLRTTFSLLPKSDDKTNLEVRGKMYVTGVGWAWLILHLTLAAMTGGLWLIVAVILVIRSVKATKAFFTDMVTDSKNMV